MNKILTALVLAVLSLSPLSAQSYASLFETEAQASMRSSVEALSSMDEAAAADFVREGFRSRGLDVLDSTDDSSFGIASPEGDTLVRHNALAWIPGFDKSLEGKYIVIGASLEGNPSGLAVLLELSERLNKANVLLGRSVVVAAFGASSQQNAGSWYFLNRSFAADAAGIDAMVDLYQLGDAGRAFYAYTASNAGLNRIIDRVSGSLQPVKPKTVTAEPAISDHRSFYAKQIPSVMFTTGDIPKLTQRSEDCSYDWMERVLEYLYNFVIELSGSEAPAFYPVEESYTPGMDAIPWNDCDVKPAFMNNYDPNVFLNKWVYVYLKYPQYAIDNGIQGRVLVDFVIDVKGKVRDVKVLRGVHQSLDAEAVKVIEASPDWRPARVRGRKVPCEMSLYVEFRLKKR